jgi:putative hydrolase of the HAD superfamily
VRFKNIAFDLDGTLYPNYSLNLRLIPFLLKEQRLLRAMGRARTELREIHGYDGDFYGTQARLMGEILGESMEMVREKNEKLIYRGWEHHFKKIRLFGHARETLDAFRSAGIKLGLLSDFPPEKKLENLGLDGYWDTVLCSEVVGRLKPDSEPFLELARRMKAKPEEILYVGNSVSYDVKGAHRAGMKAALIRPRWRKPRGEPLFDFYDYRQLCDFVLS